MAGEGDGRCAQPGGAARKNSLAYGERGIRQPVCGTEEVSHGQRPTSAVTTGLGRRGEVKRDALSEVGWVHDTVDGEESTESLAARNHTSVVRNGAASDGARRLYRPKANQTRGSIKRMSARAGLACRAMAASGTRLLWLAADGSSCSDGACYRKKALGEPYQGEPQEEEELTRNGNRNMVHFRHTQAEREQASSSARIKAAVRWPYQPTAQ